jgi:hypothetical protein
MMQEVLSRTRDPKVSLAEQEFFELSLLDVFNDMRVRYCVREAHAQWSGIDQAILFDQIEVESFWILNEAKRRYAERRLALGKKGFIYSDMDW